MHDRVVHRQVVQRGLLAGDDHVDVVAAAQAVVGDREQRVRVGRQVDADHLRLLVDDVVDEARVLMREAVVVLPPDVRREQVVERRERAAPGDVARHLQPLRVLVEHRVDDVDERLVAVEEAVAAGEQIALQPALAEVLREHLQHPPFRREPLVRGQDLRLPGPVRGLEDGGEPVRGGLVGAEEAEGLGVARDHVAEKTAENAGRLARGACGLLDLDGVVAEVGQDEVAPELAGRVRARAHPLVALRRQRGQLGHEPALVVEQLLRPVAPHPLLEQPQVLRVLADIGDRHLVRAPGALDRQPVDHLGAGPALRRAQHDHRPLRSGLPSP